MLKNNMQRNKYMGFFLTVRAGTAYRHLFPSKEKTLFCNVYY